MIKFIRMAVNRERLKILPGSFLQSQIPKPACMRRLLWHDSIQKPITIHQSMTPFVFWKNPPLEWKEQLV
jgi:hypothetical protein